VNLTGETTGYYEDFDSVRALATVLEEGFFHAGTLSTFRGRVHGRPIDLERTPTWRLVTFAQDHDQIGNRATGDRLSQSLDEGGLAIAAVLTLASPFTPMLFMGEEWAASTPWQFFTSHPEKELGEATAKGRIEEFEKMGWDPAVVPDPQDPETFTRSKLKWDEPYPPDGEDGVHTRILDLYRRLLALRKEVPELTDPRFTETFVDYDEDDRWLVMIRGSVTVAVNLAQNAVELGLDGEPLLATDPGVAALPDGAVRLPARSAVILIENA
jgi:maltooligosyltrehalose trehalohydrolase